MTDFIVSELFVYPLKSCREIKISSTTVEQFGLQHDRRWMVVDDNGVMLTQRKIAAMCLIQPAITSTGLILSTPGMDELNVDIPRQNKTSTVKVWADQCQALDAGELAANWLSQVLSTRCRLVYFPDNEFRQIDLDYANKGERTAFSDGFPLLLLSQASLDDLNQRISSPVSINRFRPNIVVDGCNAFAEDSWKKIRIGEITYRLVKPCSRCIIPNINIETGERENEPLKTLSSYRKRGNKIFFGQNIIAETTGSIEAGMTIEIIE